MKYVFTFYSEASILSPEGERQHWWGSVTVEQSMRIVEQSTPETFGFFFISKANFYFSLFNLLEGAGQHSWGSVSLEQSMRIVEQSTSAKFNMLFLI